MIRTVPFNAYPWYERLAIRIVQCTNSYCLALFEIRIVCDVNYSYLLCFIYEWLFICSVMVRIDVHRYLLCFEILFNRDFTCVLPSVGIF